MESGRINLSYRQSISCHCVLGIVMASQSEYISSLCKQRPAPGNQSRLRSETNQAHHQAQRRDLDRSNEDLASRNCQGLAWTWHRLLPSFLRKHCQVSHYAEGKSGQHWICCSEGPCAQTALDGVDRAVRGVRVEERQQEQYSIVGCRILKWQWTSHDWDQSCSESPNLGMLEGAVWQSTCPVSFQ